MVFRSIDVLFPPKMIFSNGLKLFLIFLYTSTECTTDVNFAEYQYIADHLTEEECHRLVAALHFKGFELPKEINSAERRLPKDVSCIDLLLHWNSTPREGRGETHIEVCHRLNQIGREDLADWLSLTVFKQLTKELKDAINFTEPEETSPEPQRVTENFLEGKPEDEAAWWKFDTILSIILVVCSAFLLLGAIFLCFLCCTKNFAKNSGKGYEKVSTNEK